MISGNGERSNKTTIMKFFEYLYFKYYNLGVKLGSKENASTSAIILLSFTFYLYLLDVIITLSCLFELNWDDRWIIGLLVSSYVILMLVFDITLVRFDRSTKILTKHKEEWTGKQHLFAILFPTIAFVWFVTIMVILALFHARM